MASSTPIESIPPAIEYLLYGTFGLLCLAVTIGLVILMRRHATRDEMTGLVEIDYPKIAAQLQKEILRLQALRDRIYPEGAADTAIAEANRSASSLVGGEQGASLASMVEEDLKALPEVQKILKAEIEVLTKQHQETISKLQAQSVSGEVTSAVASVADTSAKDAEIKTLKSEIEALKTQPSVGATVLDTEGMKKLEIELNGLKERLQEYEIFEDDLSRVKELSRENEELKKQLAGGGVVAKVAATPAPVSALSSAVESQLPPDPVLKANEPPIVTGGGTRTSSPDAASEEVNEAAFEAAVESDSVSVLASGESKETTSESVTAEFEKLLSGGVPLVGETSKVVEVPKGFETEKVEQDPSIVANAKSSDAILPAGDLMAEFEKLLGSAEKT